MKKIFFVVFAAALVIAPSAQAMTLRAGESYTLPRGETVSGDLYAASGTVSIIGDVTGDVVAAGGNVLISGAVGQGVLVVGGSVNLLGPVQGDVRIVGGELAISGTVNGDLVMAGGKVRIERGAVISGSVLAGAGEVTLDGRVHGDMIVSAGKICLGETAIVDGDLEYRSRQEATITAGAQVRGETRFRQLSVQQRVNIGAAAAAVFGFWMFMKFLMLLVAALFFVLVFKQTAPRLTRHAVSDFWKSLLRGFLVAVAVPIAIVLVVMTVIGVPIALIAFLGYIAWFIIASVIARVVFGSWLYKIITRSETAPVNWKTAVLGVVVFTPLSWIPVAGWFFHLVFVLVALGALAKLWYDSVWINR